MVEPEVVRQTRLLHDAGWGAKRIAAEVGVARNTVRRYLRSPLAAVQVRPSRRSLDDDARHERASSTRVLRAVTRSSSRSCSRSAGWMRSVRTVQRSGRRAAPRAARRAGRDGSVRDRAAHLFFQLVARRYERRSLLITTNEVVTPWGAAFETTCSRCDPRPTAPYSDDPSREGSGVAVRPIALRLPMNDSGNSDSPRLSRRAAGVIGGTASPPRALCCAAGVRGAPRGVGAGVVGREARSRPAVAIAGRRPRGTPPPRRVSPRRLRSSRCSASPARAPSCRDGSAPDPGRAPSPPSARRGAPAHPG